MVLGQLGLHKQKEWSWLAPFSSHSTQKLRKWIKDFNIRPEIIRLLEENIGGKPLDITLGDDFFLKLLPKQRQEKQK